MGGLFFLGFNIKMFVFGVSGIVSKVLKCLFFQVLGFFSGVAHCCSSGFGRFRYFCVSCVCFSFLSCFCFCFVCFVLGFCGWMLLFVTSLGPKPSLFVVFFLCFVFFFVLFYFFCLFFLEGLRVK